MKTAYSIVMSVICVLGTVILEGCCLGKYIPPPILTIQYDIELVLFAIGLFTAHYFLFDRKVKKNIYRYIVGILEIILSLFMLYILFFPNMLLKVKFKDCVGAVVVQFIVIVSRLIFLKHNTEDKRQGKTGDGSLS